MDRQLQPFGLTEATWLPLIYLARASAPMRQKDLAAALTLDGSSVVRLLDALAASRLIERSEENGDRRAKIITITTRGWSRSWQPSRRSSGQSRSLVPCTNRIGVASASSTSSRSLAGSPAPQSG